MSNPKTIRSAPKPQPEPVSAMPRGRWARKCEMDAYLDRNFPIPTQVVSNEEFYPLPQTPEQRAVEHHLAEMAAGSAKRLGMSRRQFLGSACGVAAAFVAMNTVFGRFFGVEAAELLEPAAVAESKTKYFIFDVQTHHVAANPNMPLRSMLLDFRRFARIWNPELGKSEPGMEDLYLENYIKEVFLDSETDVAVISGITSLTDETNILPPNEMVKTRYLVNQLTGSQRVVSHGLFSPDLGTRNLEVMHRQAEQLKIEAWKGYTGQPLGPGKEGWWLDDEKVAYPALEYSRKMKIKNICVHKGLPLFGFNVEHCSPKDVVKVSRDFPDLNFLVYHSGFKSLAEALPAARDGFKTTSYVPWVSDLCEWRRKNPHMTNAYMELGSTFGQMVITHPLLCAHVLGMIIQAFGADHVLWGTDSIWWGSPQWQIEALRRFEMPEQLMKQFGYAPLTTEVKRQIFGLNAARIYDVDPAAKRKLIPGDYIDRLRQLYRQSGVALPSNTQYGWVPA